MSNGNNDHENDNDKKNQIDLLCEDCGEAFSDFLHQMADQNAKVATCPKCGKIHESNRPEDKPVTDAKTI